MTDCYCDWCVPATTITKRHIESTRRVLIAKRVEADYFKATGIDLTKRREETEVAYTRQSDGTELEMLGVLHQSVTKRRGQVTKSAPTRAVADPNWFRQEFDADPGFAAFVRATERGRRNGL